MSYSDKYQSKHLDDSSIDCKVKNNTQVQDLEAKSETLINKFFMLLTAVCYIGTFIMVCLYDKYWEKTIMHKPKDYQLPKLSDFFYTLYIIPVLVLGKIFFEKFFADHMYQFLSIKYKDPYNEELFKMGQVYKKKLSTSLFKVTYYTLVVLIGHYVLKDMCFFPQELFGNGSMIEMFKDGVPGYLFFDKPNFFNGYYLIGLAFVITDLIWLLFVYEYQSDFYLMLLHHSITISLVMFSYLTNLSQIGVIVFYLHDITDIFVYITRLVIYSDYSDFVKLIPCSLLLISYLFYRIYLFGKLILLVYFYLNDWNPYTSILWYFKCILMIMHVYWVSQIIKRFFYFKIEDVGKVNKKEK
jgi:hypothetical protein